jgi:hypothetical protein
MKRRKSLLTFALLTVCAVIACGGGGGISSDGGRSGTGISLLRGDVVAAPGTGLDVSNIRVSLSTANLSTNTDANGRFELSGNVSGSAELRFERDSDALFARANVVIPAGGVLQLSNVVIDPNSDEARPTQQRVEFEGVVETLDCAGGTIRVRPKDEDPQATVFTVEVATATIHLGSVVLACGDLRVGDRLQVKAETRDGTTLLNADLLLEAGNDGSGGNPGEARVQFEGFVEGLDCPGGVIRVIRNDVAATLFTVDVASATIRHGTIRLGCADLRISDRVQVKADNPTGTTLVNADVGFEPGGDGSGGEGGGGGGDSHVQFEGFVVSTDCPDGAIRVSPKDDAATIFTVEVGSATIRHGTVPLPCAELRARDRVQVDADVRDGTTLVNADIAFEPGDDGSGGGDTHVQFEGFVASLDCSANVIRISPKDDPPKVFTVQVATATIRHGALILLCGDLYVGDRVEVDADTLDGTTLVNAEIVFEPGDDGSGGSGGGGGGGDTHVQFEGFVTALDCAGGTIHVDRKDDPGAIFTVDVATATFRKGAATLACGDLQVSDRIQVDGDAADGKTLVNAVIVIEEGQDGGGGDGDGHVQFEGRVTAIACAGGTFSVARKENPASVFAVDVATATIHRGTAVVTCGDLQIDDRVQVDADTSDGTRLVNADIIVEEGEDGGGSGDGAAGSSFSRCSASSADENARRLLGPSVR